MTFTPPRYDDLYFEAMNRLDKYNFGGVSMSSDYKIKISEPCAVELRKQAESMGLTINTLMTQLIEERATVTPSIDIAAGVFLSYLEPEHRKFIMELAEETKRSPAAYIMSYINLAHDRGETAVPVAEAVDPSTQPPLSLANGTAPSPTLCEWCQRPFTSTQEGQRYCPPPELGESCGRQASLAAIRASRQKRSESSIPAPHIVNYEVRT